jgi:hypothetical protein
MRRCRRPPDLDAFCGWATERWISGPSFSAAAPLGGAALI